MITYTTEFYNMLLQYYENSLKQKKKKKKKENKTKQKKKNKILLTIKIEKII